MSQSSYTPQYHELFRQIVDSYLKSREPVGQVVQKNLKKFAGSGVQDDDFKLFVRRCVQYVFDICENELKLINRFFVGGPILKQYPDLSSWNTYGKYTEKLEQNRLSHIKSLYTFLTSYLGTGDLHRICDLINWLELTYLDSSDGDEDPDIPQEHGAVAQFLLSEYLWPLSDTLFSKSFCCLIS